MRKNIAMRLASFLLIGVLLSMSIISGTWAKYVTTANNGDGGETATVAKWGITITADFDNNEYQTLATSVIDSGVSSTGNAKLLAPGSGVKFAKFNISGTPEVAVIVKYNAVINFGENWKYTPETGISEVYMPLVFLINGTPIAKYGDEINPTLDTNDDGKISTLEEYKAVIESSINSHTELYAAGTNLGDTNGGTTGTPNASTLTVACYWDFDTQAGDGANDLKDTQLGQAAADRKSVV